MKAVFCQQCGRIDKPTSKAPGSGVLGCALMFFFIIPGILYFIWRGTSGFQVCATCGSRNIVPLDSPAAPPTRLCTECQFPASYQTARCINCGAPLAVVAPPAVPAPGPLLFCTKCGTRHGGAAYCRNCGAKTVTA